MRRHVPQPTQRFAVLQAKQPPHSRTAGDTMQIRWLSIAYVTGGCDAPDYITEREAS